MNNTERPKFRFSDINLIPSKRVSAGILAAGLAITGVGFGGENEARAETKNSSSAIVIPGEMPSLKEGVIEEILSPTPDYAIKQQETAEFKEILKEKECQEINLDFCAGLLYSIEKSDGFKDPQVFDKWQESILGDYITAEQVYEFGKTGKGLDVVYFKDEKGKKTKEPAICYVANPENKKFKVSDIEKAITFWEKPAPGFLRAMVANDVRVLFQSQASSNKKIQVFKYEYGIIYYNYSMTDSRDFVSGLGSGMAPETFGVRGDALGGEFDKYAVGVIKTSLVLDCCNYIVKKTGDKNIGYLLNHFQLMLDLYKKSYWTDRGKSEEELLGLIKKIKDNNLMTPFGAETWEEIDSVKK